MGFLPFLFQIGSAASPHLLDWITGSSKKYKKSQDAILKNLLQMSNEYRAMAGSSPYTSSYFQSAMPAFNLGMRRAYDMLQKMGSARNLTNEALMGGVAQTNEALQSTLANLYAQAESARQNLLNTANQLQAQALQSQAEFAKQRMEGTAKLGSSLGTVLGNKDVQDFLTQLFKK